MLAPLTIGDVGAPSWLLNLGAVLGQRDSDDVSHRTILLGHVFGQPIPKIIRQPKRSRLYGLQTTDSAEHLLHQAEIGQTQVVSRV